MNKETTIYHADHLPKDAGNISYSYDWSKVTDKTALDARKKQQEKAAAAAVKDRPDSEVAA